MNNVLLATLIVSFLFEGTFFLSLAMIYQSIEKKVLRITNTFIFETAPGFKEKNSFLNYFFFFSLLVWFFPFVYFASSGVNTYSVTMMVLALLSGFCLASLPFVPLNKLREHFYLDLGAIVALLALFAIEAFYGYHLYHYYTNTHGLIGMIVSIVLGAFVLVPVCNPKLFDLKNNQNEDGTYSRKKFIFLAFTEWMLYPLSILVLLPLFLITMA